MVNTVSDWKERQIVGLILGPLIFLLITLSPTPHNMSAEAWQVAAIAALMATWWVTEAIPLAATALLPIVLFPLLGVMSTSTTTSAYANHLIFLFMGGFLIAMAIQKWNLHKRIALHTLRWVGVSPPRIILGFMLATAFLSMWISNTATVMMMLPIALAVIRQLEGDKTHTGNASANASQFGTAVMLSIAYAASIGGVATLIGTPPNAILAGMLENLYQQRISFVEWMGFGVPLSLTMLCLAWFYLTRLAYPTKPQTSTDIRALIGKELAELGPMSRQEKWISAVFTLVAIGWIVRGLFDIPLFEGVSDATIAMTGALLLFVIPVNMGKKEFLLDWPAAVKLPWDILLLFGGGFALAQGFSNTGLTEWIGTQLSVLQGTHLIVIVLAITLVVIFLTEVTSNTATATLILPVMGALAHAMDMQPLSLMLPAAVAASYAFMLPVATPPNAIVFSSRYITIPQMARAGLWMNLIASLMITGFVLLLMPNV